MVEIKKKQYENFKESIFDLKMSYKFFGFGPMPVYFINGKFSNGIKFWFINLDSYINTFYLENFCGFCLSLSDLVVISFGEPSKYCYRKNNFKDFQKLLLFHGKINEKPNNHNLFFIIPLEIQDSIFEVGFQISNFKNLDNLKGNNINIFVNLLYKNTYGSFWVQISNTKIKVNIFDKKKLFLLSYFQEEFLKIKKKSEPKLEVTLRFLTILKYLGRPNKFITKWFTLKNIGFTYNGKISIFFEIQVGIIKIIVIFNQKLERILITLNNELVAKQNFKPYLKYYNKNNKIFKNQFLNY